MLRIQPQRGQALIMVLTFIATFALILWAAAFFVSGSFKAQGAVVGDTRATYAVDAALQWGLGYIRLNSLTCAAATPSISPAIPSPGPSVNGYNATVTISADAACAGGAEVFNLIAQAGPRQGQAKVAFQPIVIAYVQGASAGNATQGSLAAAFPASVTAGNAIVVAAVVGGGAAVSGVTDTAGNTYLRAVTDSSNPGSTEVSVWYTANAIGGATTMTATFTQASDAAAIAVHEYSGLATTAPLDRTAGAGGQSAAQSSGATLATTQARELVFGATGDKLSGALYTAGAGFTGRLSLSSTLTADVATEDQVITATGAQTATFTSAPATTWSCVVATFKGAAGGAWTLTAYALQ